MFKHLTIWRTGSVQNDAEFVSNVLRKLTKLKPATNGEARPASCAG